RVPKARPRSIRLRPPKEGKSNIAFDLQVNPVRIKSGVFYDGLNPPDASSSFPLTFFPSKR
ncbi:hypothetical protein C6A37_07840, partial [Desulfobacteraceae bacterium SEEP-SAG9]